MPERLEQVEVAPSVPEKSQPEGSPDVEKVSWPVEDPSEYRPELAPGGDLENLGKDVEDFRVYYAVRRQTINLTGVFHRASTYDRFFPRRKAVRDMRLSKGRMPTCTLTRLLILGRQWYIDLDM